MECSNHLEANLAAAAQARLLLVRLALALAAAPAAEACSCTAISGIPVHPCQIFTPDAVVFLGQVNEEPVVRTGAHGWPERVLRFTVAEAFLGVSGSTVDVVTEGAVSGLGRVPGKASGGAPEISKRS